MNFALTALLAFAGGPQDDYIPLEETDLYESFIKLRAGAWGSSGFDFQAIRTDSKFVQLKDEVLISGGIDLGVEIARRLVIFGTAEISGTDNIRSEMVGAYVGIRDYKRPGAAKGIPDRAMIYAGAIWATYDVTNDVDGEEFGNFDDAFGFGGGLELTWNATSALTMSLIGEFRLIKFDYELPIVSGDTHAGGPTGWVGAAFELRF